MEKRSIGLISLILFILFSLSGCKKEDLPPGQPDKIKSIASGYYDSGVLVDSLSGIINYTYDADGRLSTEETISFSGKLSYEYQYQADRILLFSHSGPYLYEYIFLNSKGLVDSTSANHDTASAKYTYNSSGQLIKRVFYDLNKIGSVETATVDGNDDIIALERISSSQHSFVRYEYNDTISNIPFHVLGRPLGNSSKHLIKKESFSEDGITFHNTSIMSYTFDSSKRVKTVEALPLDYPAIKFVYTFTYY